jgi:hypothetical protein
MSITLQALHEPFRRFSVLRTVNLHKNQPYTYILLPTAQLCQSCV